MTLDRVQHKYSGYSNWFSHKLLAAGFPALQSKIEYLKKVWVSYANPAAGRSPASTAYDQTDLIEPFPAETFITREKELVQVAKAICHGYLP